MIAGAGVVLPISTGPRRTVIVLCAVLFLLGGLLAFYSVGVEEHWWAGVAGRDGELPQTFNLSRFRDETATRPSLRPCDVDVWRIFGLSLAAYNSVIQAALSGGCLIALQFVDAGPGSPSAANRADMQ